METDPVNHMVGVISVEGRPGLFWFSISGKGGAPGGPVPSILSPSPQGTILLSPLKVMFPGILCLGCEW